jgi:hypothetical protein
MKFPKLKQLSNNLTGNIYPPPFFSLLCLILLVIWITSPQHLGLYCPADLNTDKECVKRYNIALTS